MSELKMNVQHEIMFYYWLILSFLRTLAFLLETEMYSILAKSVLIHFFFFFLHSPEGCSGQNISVRCVGGG